MLAVLPARNNSQGFPGKNIHPVCGHPMIAWGIHAARSSGLFDRIIVSTDGDEIADVSSQYGAEVYWRPDELATDTATPKNAVLYLLNELEDEGYKSNYTVLLQPTSPLRLVEDITACVALQRSGKYDSVASFCPAEPSPLRAFHLDEGCIAEPVYSEQEVWKRRQTFKPQYHLNGAVYVVETDPFRANKDVGFLYGKIGAHLMPTSRSLDVDTLPDLLMAGALMTDYDVPRKPDQCVPIRSRLR